MLTNRIHSGLKFPFPLVALSCLVAIFSVKGSENVQAHLPESFFPELRALLAHATEELADGLPERFLFDEAEAGRRIHSSPLYPRLSASAQTHLQYEDQQAGGSRDTVSGKLFYSLHASQPLYHWGALQANSRIGELQARIAAGNWEEARRLLLVDVRSAYLSLVVRRMAVRNRDYHAEIADRRLARAESGFEAGELSPGEYEAMMLAYDEATLEAERARYDFASLRESFLRLVGPQGEESTRMDRLPEGIPSFNPDSFPVQELARYYAGGSGLDHSTRLERVERAIEIEEKQLHIARVALRPKFNLVAGATQDDRGFAPQTGRREETTILFGGLQATWNLFDGFRARGEREVAQSRKRRLESDREQTREMLKGDAARLERRIDIAGRSMIIRERQVRFAEDGLSAKKEDVEAGLASEEELDQVRGHLYDAQLGANHARFEFLDAVVRFVSHLERDPLLKR